MKDQNFDYIVVGAGSAGCVVAARLSENPTNRVLLIEAGRRERSVLISMPAALAYPLTRDRILWRYDTGPEPGLDGRSVDHVRGKLMGGSSSINGMVFVRGNRRDYDGWAADGLTEWSYDKILPYFRKLEDFDRGANAWRGANGPLRITSCKAQGAIFDSYLTAGQQAGLALNDDYNAKEQEGVHRYQANIVHGVRGSADRAWLAAALSRPNLTVMTGATAQRLLTDGTRVRGLRVQVRGAFVDLQADREVILSGGTYETPKLLMLSGIGEGDHLRDMGLPVLTHLPEVGANLQDHPCVGLGYNAARAGVSPVVGMGLVGKAMVGANWLFRRKGLGATNFWETGAFFKSGPEADYADIQHEFIPMIGDFTHGSNDLLDGFLYQVCLMRPRSRGRLRLRSADPAALPSIVHNYLTHPDDLRDLRNGVRRTEEMIAQTAWDEIRGTPWGGYRPGMSDGEMEAWIRANASTQYHPCGTCALGQVTDQTGRVQGVTGLRVIDASLIPRETSGNLNAPTLMIAEKLSDAIKAGH